jgi:hypothetical protein
MERMICDIKPFPPWGLQLRRRDVAKIERGCWP